MINRSAIAAMLALAAVWAAAASESEDTGMRLEFDGETMVFLPKMEGARTGFTRFASVDAVSIEGAAGPARLVLELALPPGSRTGDQPHDARISFRPDGFRNYWVSPPEIPQGAVTINLLDLSGPSPRVAGHFHVPLCFAATPIHTPDLSHCLPASGRFDTALVRD